MKRRQITPQINATGWQIDALVYELYRLTSEGITVVEGADNFTSPYLRRSVERN